MSQSPLKQRIRLTFGKHANLKYIGQLDLAKLWERVLRRAAIPVLYSQGFNTRPRLQLASALPLGITSDCEIIDVQLRETIELDDLPERLHAVSPAGLVIYDVQTVPNDGPALQTLVRASTYRIRFEDPINPDALREAVRRTLDAEQIIRTRRSKRRDVSFDMRPLILDLHLDEAGDLIAELAVGDRGNLRPDQLLHELGFHELHHSVHRLKLYLED